MSWSRSPTRAAGSRRSCCRGSSTSTPEKGRRPATAWGSRSARGWSRRMVGASGRRATVPVAAPLSPSPCPWPGSPAPRRRRNRPRAGNRAKRRASSSWTTTRARCAQYATRSPRPATGPAGREGPIRTDRDVGQANRLHALRLPALDFPDAAERGIEPAGGHVVVLGRRPDQPVATTVPHGARSHHDAEPRGGPSQRAISELPAAHRAQCAALGLLATAGQEILKSAMDCNCRLANSATPDPVAAVPAGCGGSGMSASSP